MAVEPFSNWTVPVAADGVTVALSCTDVPNVTGLAGVVVSPVVVEIPLTVNGVDPVEPA